MPESQNNFYITTPLYYVNDRPHLGTAYCTITADVLNRYHKLFGRQTCLLTGTDEHGQKCQQAAEKRGLSPQEHCDDMVKAFKEAWQELYIDYDIFFRTTDPFHKEAVQASLQQLYDKGEIYAKDYSGWYCVSDEMFYTEKDLIDGKTPDGKEVTWIEEKNYFFQMSKYQQALIDHIQSHPKFIQPESRRNEVLGFLRQPLADLCISRPKSRLSWGVEIPFDRDYVTYVWFDALLNYATGVGFQQPDRKSEFARWWGQGDPSESSVHHLLGKDILTTHAVYWPAMLMALGAPLPRVIYAHGWILNKDAGKMSKSQGHVINPLDLKDIVGVDALRYFLVRDIHLGNDAPISEELIVGRSNTDLANNLGNLYSRTSNLIGKYFSGSTPSLESVGGDLGQSESARSLQDMLLKTPELVRAEIEKFSPSRALEQVVLLLNQANKYLEETAPWKTAKEDLASAGQVLLLSLEVLRTAAVLLHPVMPYKMDDLLGRLGQAEAALNWDSLSKVPAIAAGTPIQKGEPLFPKI